MNLGGKDQHCHPRSASVNNVCRLGAGAILVVVLAVSVGACGGASHASSTRSFVPGQDSPEAAVAGFMTSIAKNEGSQACAYALPAQVSVCTQFVTTTAVSVAQWSFGNSFVYGDQALVTLVADKFCAGGSCMSNSDPNKGLPHAQNDFPAAFGQAQGNSSSPAVPCVRINGQWYLIVL